ncbi:hypothetical protein L1887_03160 [Cichorium endivia]|nr:hypothetical protein L1887_03160 [Cichorium endivia]
MAEHHRPHKKIKTELAPDILYFNILPRLPANLYTVSGITKHRYDDKYYYLVLWNPVTGDYKRLSKSNSYKECYEVTGRAYGLYYSNSDDDYKLLIVTHDHYACIYSLKSNSWRKLDSKEDLKRIQYVVSESWGESLLQNDKLFFLKKGKRRTIAKLSYSIPVYLMRDGKWLTYCLHSGCHVYKLDLDKHLNEMAYSNADDSMDITPRGKYIETLVSPNRYRE